MNAPAPIEEEGDDRRTQLLKIAASLFADVGFEATTIRTIAKKADILSGSLYYHFGTKEDMLHAILARGVRELLATVRVSEAPADPETRLIALALLHINGLFDDQHAFAILYNDRRFLRRQPDFEYVTEAKRVMFSSWRIVLRQGQEAGLFRRELDEFLAITTIVRMLSTSADWLMGRHDYTYDGPVPSDPEQLIDFNLDTVMRIVRVPERMAEPVQRAAAARLLATL